MSKKLNETEVFEELSKIHNNKYEYICLEKNDKNKQYVRYICPIHGEVKQRLENHRKGVGCEKCSRKKCISGTNKKLKDKYLPLFKTIYGDKYKIIDIIKEERRDFVIYECPKHGVQKQRLDTFKKGNGCPLCKNLYQSSSDEELIKRAIEVHGNKYEYIKIERKDNEISIIYNCHKHGIRRQRYQYHINGGGCIKCYHESLKGVPKTAKEDLIKKFREIHGDKYDYSKVDFKGMRTKVCIICPTHGEFWLSPENHLKGYGCRKCKRRFNDSEEIIHEFERVHNSKYTYPPFKFQNVGQEIDILCPIHGNFPQTISNHLKGCGCPYCSHVGRKNTEMFIKEAKEIHGKDYDYSKVEYRKYDAPVCIICHKQDENGVEHGEFWQTPSHHLHGCGCDKCNNSRLEREIRIFLENNGIEYENFKRFVWLGRQNLDFYLPKYNIGIECQGIQHFEKVDHFGGELHYSITLERDERKRKLCEENGIKLLYYSNLGIEYPYEVFEDKEKLLEEIKKYGNS